MNFMKNFKTLLLQELKGQIRTFTFLVMMPAAIIISILISNFQIDFYKARKEVFQEQQLQSNERLKEIFFYSDLKVDLFVPPSVLSIFSKGIDESIGNKLTVSILDQPELKTTSQQGNAFIKIFNNMDITGIIKIMSIFIVLLAACPIVKDREERTGKLIFANSVGRFEYFLSKYVSLMIIAFVMVFTVMIIPVIWMNIDPKIELTSLTYGSILLILLACICYLSIYILISLTLSAICSRMSIATLYSLIVWTILAFIYPYTANSVIDRMIPVVSDYSISDQIQKMDENIMFDNMKFIEETDNFINRSWCSMSQNDIGLITEYTMADKNYFNKAKAIVDNLLPKWWKRISDVDAMKENQKKQLLSKKLIYDKVTFLIPDRTFQSICDYSAETDYNFREKRFTDAAKSYRSVFMDYVKSKGGFGYPFFTQVPEQLMLDNYEDYPPGFEERYCENLKPLDLSDLPQFDMPTQSKIAESWIGLLISFAFSVLLSLFVYFKYLSFN
jgi:ABC-type transport system involved in multi-copper enzyme maturation permease subunit